jgi:mRNA interferase MazF
LPHRGDIVAFRQPKEAAGHEQRGHRYGIVLQSDDLEWLSTLLVAPTSTSAQPTIFRPELTVRGRKTRVMVDQLAAIDRSRIGRTAGRLTAMELREVDAALRDVLGHF